MKFYLKPFRKSTRKIRNTGIILFGLIILLLLGNLFHPRLSIRIFSNAETAVEFRIREKTTTLNDSLPHFQYRRLADSIQKQVQDENLWINTPGSGLALSGFGAYTKIHDQDTAYYLNVPGYYTETGFHFYREDGKYHVSILSPRENIKAQQTPFRTEGAYQVAETELTFVKEDEVWTVGYPVSKSAHDTWTGIIVALMVLFGGISFYTLLGLPIRFFFLIAKGDFFNEEIIGILYTIAAYLIAVGGFLSISRLALHLYYKYRMIYPMQFSIYDDVLYGSGWIIAGLAVLLFAKAFLHGVQLQEEQELTV